MKRFVFDDTAHGPTWLAAKNNPRPRPPLPTPSSVQVEVERFDWLWILVPALAPVLAMLAMGAVVCAAFYLRGK